MRLLLALSACAIAALAGTAPPELAVIGEPSTTLNATYSVGSTEISFYPGEFLNASTAQDAPLPHLHDSGLNSTGRYLMLMVDPDWNITTPPSVIVHTVVANLTTESNSTSEANVVAKYIAPQPKSGTHNYTLFLFDQPSNFSIPSSYASFMATTDQTPLNRLNLPLESFLNQTGLGAPVAANYFRVTAAAANNTSTTTPTSTSTSSPTGTVASTTSSAAAMKMADVGHYYLAAAIAVGGVAAVTV